MARLNYINKINKSSNKLDISNKSFWYSLRTLHSISEDDIINLAGLDAYVFLGFFKMSIKLLLSCWLFAVTIISPIRFHYTGNYDDNDTVSLFEDSEPSSFNGYLATYALFTYIFTYITCKFLLNQSEKIIRKRQEILGKQNSITDRTIRLSGIPPQFRSEKNLKEIIENLNIGKVEKIIICKEWKNLNSLLKVRFKIIKKLEFYWSNYMKINTLDTVSMNFDSSVSLTDNNNNITQLDIENTNNSFYNNPEESTTSLISTASIKLRPKIKTGFLGLFGNKIDALDYYTNQLSIIDEEIQNARKQHYSATPTAFITMDSVATAQTLGQAVIDPRIGYLITNIAPAPNDVIWENAILSNHSRKLKIYYITVITGILGVIFIFPVGYLATLLNYKSIKKFWPDLANFLLKHEWISKFVIDLLPVYLYTLLNGLIPFLYVWLSSKQGFISYGEMELSIVSKNFFYVFVNLFLVFTMAGTASNYWGYLSDSKKLALQLAQSLRGLSSFYIDTILLQGIGLMPFKLLPWGKILQFIYFSIKNFLIGKLTTREIISLYEPPKFNFGLQLPIPLLTLIITLIYSVISTKILSAGLIYFIIGYYIYKYLLIYTYIHPQHSTGKVMPIIFRRIILGLLLFQLTSVGSLILEKSWILALSLSPLPLITLMVLYYFEEKLKPLSIFIALRAIQIDELKHYSDEGGFSSSISRNDNNNTVDNIWNDNILNNNNNNNKNTHPKTSTTGISTIDERREVNMSYEYPPMVDELEGPWIGIEKCHNDNNDDNNNNNNKNDTWILVWTNDGIVRKKVNFNQI